MNNINIIHELCAEDRARIDRLTDALEAIACANYGVKVAPPNVEPDPIQQKLAETLARAQANTHAEPAKTAAEATKPETLTTDHPAEEETPFEDVTPATEAEKPTVTLKQIQQKVVTMSVANGGAKKAKIREIINAYAAKVSDLPEDKWTEVWEKLTALEGEA